MIRWNIAIYAGIGAFGLSFIIGILSGNPFTAILFRALLFGIIFTGLGAVASFVMSKYVPEIFDSVGQPVKEGTDSENVDIVLPEEGPVMTESLLEDKDKVSDVEIAENEETAELETAEDVEPTDGFDDYEEVAEKDNIIVEDTEIKEKENVNAKPVENMYGVNETDNVNEDYNNIVVEEINNVENGEFAAVDTNEQENNIQEQTALDEKSGETSPETRQEKITDEEIDELPDMGVLENSFMVISSEGTQETNQLPSVQSRLSGKVQKKENPEVYAQAVRTIIKRDEEGPKKYGR